MFTCLNCQHEAVWQNDFDSEDYGYEREGIVQVFVCPNCGAEITMFVPTNNNNNNDDIQS